MPRPIFTRPFWAYFELRWMRLFLLNKLALVSHFFGCNHADLCFLLLQQKIDLLAGLASTISNNRSQTGHIMWVGSPRGLINHKVTRRIIWGMWSQGAKGGGSAGNIRLQAIDLFDFRRSPWMRTL